MLLNALDRVVSRQNNPEDPTKPLEPHWLLEALGAVKTASGVRINERNALNIAAVYGAVRLITNTVASTPLMVYRRLARGKERAMDHHLWRLLHDRPNSEMPAFIAKEVAQGHIETWGNAYFEMELRGDGAVVGLWPLMPDRTHPERVNGVKRFVTHLPSGEEVVLPARRVMHIPGYGYDGFVGMSPIRFARESLGLTKATEAYGAGWFGSGARPSGVLTHPATLSAKARNRLRQDWDATHSGLSNVQRIAIIEEGMKWEQMGIPPEDSQFLETRRFQVQEVARWFGVPLHMLADQSMSPASNVEQSSIDFGRLCMRPRFVRWEQVVNWDVVPQGSLFAEFNMDALLRGDTVARSTYYREMFGIGGLSQNDIRELENMNPIDGGDFYYVPLNMAAVGPNGPTKPPKDEPPEDRLLPIFEDAASRCLNRELIAAERAAKKGPQEFRQWVETFYGKHRDYITEQFTAPLTVAGQRDRAPAIAAAWIARSQAALNRATDQTGVFMTLRQWKTERVPQEVGALLAREVSHADGSV